MWQADRGFASGAFFWGGGRGRFGKKGVTLRGLRISEKKEILHKLTVHTYIRNYYISTLSTKDFAKINKITMVTPFVWGLCWRILLNYVNWLRKKLISTLIYFILFFDLLPPRSPRNQSDRAPLTSPSGHAFFPTPPPSRPPVFSWLLCVVRP